MLTTYQASKRSVTHDWQSHRQTQSHLSKPETHALSYWVSGALQLSNQRGTRQG